MIGIASKSFWAVLGMGDFYYEIAVQVIEACIQTRPLNGGIIELASLLELVNQKRSKSAAKVTAEDIVKTVATVKVLGNGFRIIETGGQKLIQSVPLELTDDHSTVISIAQVHLCLLKAIRRAYLTLCRRTAGVFLNVSSPHCSGHNRAFPWFLHFS